MTRRGPSLAVLGSHDPYQRYLANVSLNRLSDKGGSPFSMTMTRWCNVSLALRRSRSGPLADALNRYSRDYRSCGCLATPAGSTHALQFPSEASDDHG